MAPAFILGIKKVPSDRSMEMEEAERSIHECALVCLSFQYILS